MSTVAVASPFALSGELLDFADRWPAMVVKELRQGLRARGFVAAFLVLQLLALGAVAVEFLLTRTAAGGGSRRTILTLGPSLFWVAVYGMVSGVMPLRLMESLRGECVGRNVELLLLGGLTRWQIVRGKWLVQAMLTLLTLVSLLPYLLVRYFFGGVELVPNLFSLCSVTAAALGMAGCVLGASGYSSLGIRFSIIAVAGLLLGTTSLLTEVMIASAKGPARLEDLVIFANGFGCAILFHGLYTLIGLQLGRAHLKLFLAPYEMSPTKSLLVMLLAAPFILLVGGLVTKFFGTILVLILLIYAVSKFDKTPPGVEALKQGPSP